MVIEFLVYSIMLIAFAFLVFRVIVRGDYSKRSKLSFPSYSLEVLVFGIHANMIYLFIPVKWPNVPPLPGNAPSIFLTILSIVFGFVVLIIAWFNLGSGVSLGLDKNKLKISGIYQYSRNPQLVGYGIILLVFAVLLLSWYSAGWFLQYLIISYFMILSEEEFLHNKYGADYEEYCKNVPRIYRYK